MEKDCVDHRLVEHLQPVLVPSDVWSHACNVHERNGVQPKHQLNLDTLVLLAYEDHSYQGQSSDEILDDADHFHFFGLSVPLSQWLEV